MTLAINKYHFNIGLPAAITFLITFAGLIWKGSDWAHQFLDKQDKIYAYIVTHEQNDARVYRMVDSIEAWRPADIAERSVLKSKYNDMEAKIANMEKSRRIANIGTGFFTERKVNGRIIFERVNTSTK